MGSNYWIKLWHEMLDDPKMGRLPDRCWRRAVELFLVAGEINEGGKIPAAEELSWRLRVDAKELGEDLVALQGAGIIESLPDGWLVVNFEKRQAAMSNAERAERWRDKERTAEYYGNESQQEGERETNETFVDTDTDQIQIADSDTEKDNSQVATPPETQARPPPDKLTAGQRGFLDAFGAKRYKTHVQRSAVLELEQEYGTEMLLEAAKWASTLGMSVGKAIVSCRGALPNWGKEKRPKGAEPKAWEGIRQWAEEQGIGGDG